MTRQNSVPRLLKAAAIGIITYLTSDQNAPKKEAQAGRFKLGEPELPINLVSLLLPHLPAGVRTALAEREVEFVQPQ